MRSTARLTTAMAMAMAATMVAGTSMAGAPVSARAAGPTIEVSSASVVEQDVNQRTDAVFAVTMDQIVSSDVTFRARTRNDSAVANRDFDFFTKIIRIPAGQQHAEIRFTVLGDLLFEGDETFFVDIIPVSDGVHYVSTTVTGTIIDNEPTPAVSVGDVMVTESGIEMNTRNRGGNDMRALVPFSLSAAPTEPVHVSWRTVDGTALAGEHYTASTGTFTFRPGVTFRGVKVPLDRNDATPEVDRMFGIEITDVTGPAGLGDGAAVVNVIDDDHRPVIVLGDDIEVIEGDDGLEATTINVSLDRPSERDVRVTVRPTDGTAIGGQRFHLGADFVNLRNQRQNTTVVLKFFPGMTTRDVSIDIKGDTDVEPDETFAVVFEPFRNVDPAVDGPVVVTIVNDD